MKNIYDVIRDKEEEMQRVKQELDALRLVARLLSDDVGEKGASSSPQPAPSRVKVFP